MYEKTYTKWEELMPNIENEELNTQQSETRQQNVADMDDYISAINEIKQNTVSREAYEKLEADNKKLFKALTESAPPTEQTTKKEVDLEQVRDKLFNNDLSNLEYAKNAVLLRDELIAKGERDPFLPFGKNILPTEDDIYKAEKVADCLKTCIEIADGDSSVFTNELQRRLVDSGPVIRKTIRR